MAMPFVPRGLISLDEAVSRLADHRGISADAAGDELRLAIHGKEIEAVIQITASGRIVSAEAWHWGSSAAAYWLMANGSVLLCEGEELRPFGPYIPGDPNNFVLWPKGEDGHWLINEESFLRYLLPPPDSTPGTTGQPTTPPPDPPQRNKGGRPPEYNWAEAKEIARAQVAQYGMPGRDNPRLPTQEDLVNLTLEHFSKRDLHPSVPNVRKRVASWLDEFAQLSKPS
jgi:hypothetical protein